MMLGICEKRNFSICFGIFLNVGTAARIETIRPLELACRLLIKAEHIQARYLRQEPLPSSVRGGGVNTIKVCRWAQP